MRYQQWNLRPGGAAARRRMEAAGLAPLCAAVLAARGLDGPEEAERFLASGWEHIHDPLLLRDMDKAVERIRRAVEQGETVAVYGDYDVDGITSTCLLTEALAGMGAKVVSYIPERTEEGYGLNKSAVARLAEGGVSLIITVDCGITAVAEVEFARSLGVEVVITDHHQCKEKLPAACAVVDPRRPDCGYPFPELAGVGVALKLAQALAPAEERERVFLRFGELAAVGTVADVMHLTGENRALVRQGLELLGRTNRPGLRALIREAGLEPGAVPTAVTIGYGLAPRINAAGRIEQAMVALELLLTREEDRGEVLAHTLCRLNRERQAIEMDILEQCAAMLEGVEEPGCIVLAGEGWHQGVVGIVASRLTERYSCPAFIICLENGKGKGSCRSFGGFNLFGALDQCADLLEGYGGHEMAAGFTILEENIPLLAARLKALVSAYTGGRPMETAIDVDAEIDSCAQLTCPQVEALSALEPFGTGNPKPVFLLRSAAVLSCCDVGGGRHLKMKLRRDGVVLCGAYGQNNAGDEAVLKAVLAELRAIDPDMPLWVMTRKPKQTRLSYRAGAVYTFNLPAFCRHMSRSVLYINGGGSLIQDVTSHRSLWFYLFTLAAARRLGCKVMMYGCGIGPVTRPGDVALVRRVLNTCVDAITLREDGETPAQVQVLQALS